MANHSGFTALTTITLRAGTATAGTAPLILVTGTALATPEDGAIEYHGSHLYFTIGSTRYQLDQQTTAEDASFITLGTDGTVANERVLTGTSNQIVVTDNGAGSTVVLSTPQNIHTAATPTFAGMNLGSSNLSTVGNISLENSAARDITVAQASGTTGRNLTVQSGQSVTGGSNEVGGTLLLKANAGTGSNTGGHIEFWTATDTGSGTTTQTVSEKMRLLTSGNGRLIIGSVTSIPNTADGITLRGDTARNVIVSRHSTSNTAGVTLTVQSGGATSAATDKAAGNLILATGLSTGAGAGSILLQTTGNTAGSTSDNSLTTRLTIDVTGITPQDGLNLILGTSTGMKIGTATTQKLGFYNATPIVQPSAYTQTYSTADKTHANLTSATLTDNSAGTGNTTIEALTSGTVYATDVAAIRNNFADLAKSDNAIIVDLTDLKQLVNSLIDDLQTLGLVG